MHSVLLVDEILENILNYILDWEESEQHWQLTQVARCCKAWKDPGLDRLWNRLGDIKPVFNVVDPDALSSYTKRVKYITLRDGSQKLTKRLVAFPNLRSAYLEGSGCHSAIHWPASRALRKLKIDMRSSNPRAEAQTPYIRSKCVAKMIEDIQEHSVDGLEELYIRGYMTSSLNNVVGTLTTLRSLTLLTAGSLPPRLLEDIISPTFVQAGDITPRLLVEISAFPFLQDLRIQAAHIDADWFRTIRFPSDRPHFPSLRKLHIRSSQALMHVILDLLQPSTLEQIHLEADCPALDVNAWTPIMETLAVKASQSLREVNIEHYPTIQLDLIPIAHLNLIPFSASSSFTLQNIKPLAACKYIRKFTLDTSIPVKFTDKDLEEMASWWRHLEHLDLGTLPTLNHNEDPNPNNPSPPTQALTTKALVPLARYCSELKHIILPLSLSASCDGPDLSQIIPQRTLKTLRIGHVDNPQIISDFVKRVISIFPCVEAIECETSDGQVPVSLPNRQESDAGEGTADGFANEQ